jgi:hypothetical protein
MLLCGDTHTHTHTSHIHTRTHTLQTTGHAMASETVVAIVNDTALTAAMQRVCLCVWVCRVSVCV